MADVIFARTRHVYESYRDFWRLVDLAGYPTCYADEVDASDPTRCYIVTPLNGEWEQGWPDANARLIHWDLEWRLNGDYPQVSGVREVWASDKWYAQQIGARYVPMGSDVRLADGDTPDGELYDAAYLGYMIPRRTQMRLWLEECGLSLSPSSAWHEARHAILKHSRAYLHVHQRDDAPTIAPLRMVVAAAYGLPVITERVMDAGLFGHSYLMSSDYAHLASFARLWLRDEGREHRLKDIGAALHSLLCEYLTFRHSVEGAL